MKFVKVDPITGEYAAHGTCPDGEEQPAMDDMGLLVFAYEGTLADYQFDHSSMALVLRPVDSVVELRRRLFEERRQPTAEELAEINPTGPAPVLTPAGVRHGI